MKVEVGESPCIAPKPFSTIPSHVCLEIDYSQAACGMMLSAVLSGFVLAALAPWLTARLGGRVGWLFALLPAAIFVWLASYIPAIAAGETFYFYTAWIPGLDINLSFLLDGLSLLFGLLISGIGVFILIYAGKYLQGEQYQGRFFLFLLSFMASMLGLVFSSNLIALFVFWELTSVTSYMLIGYHHEDEKSRKSAQQGLYVTVGGGLALMAGLIALAVAGGSYELTELLSSPEVIQEHALYLPLLLLILAGTFTKSAQVPFHFWLPNAMAAPTPVSAYLHSATMVKAGVYLMARLHPALGGTEAWLILLGLFGASTMFVGSFLAIRSSGLKSVLAYSTVMALGTLTMLIGIGSPTAIAAAVSFLLAHSLYKGALFMTAGNITHETGLKDFRDLGGLRHEMPLSTLFGVLAALSLAGILPFFGFIAKELMFEAVLRADTIGTIITVLALLSGMMTVAVAAIVGLRPWFGARKPTKITPHDPPLAQLLGPAVLATLGLLLGLMPFLAEHGVLSAAALAVAGEPVELKLSLWHGFNLPLLMSGISLAVGALIFWQWDQIRETLAARRFIDRFGPESGYEALMRGLVIVADWQTRILQNGSLRYYIFTTVATLLGLLAYTVLTRYPVWPGMDFAGVELHTLAIAVLIILATLVSVSTHSRLGAVATVGAVGFGVALMYVLFSAPDVGITQLLVETLTVILLVLVLFRLPGFLDLSKTDKRLADAAVAILLGLSLTLLLLMAVQVQLFPSISEYFIEHSYPSAHGRNIVNVILVDFRALDTLGEIFVLALAAIGVYAMIKLRAEDRKP